MGMVTESVTEITIRQRELASALRAIGSHARVLNGGML